MAAHVTMRFAIGLEDVESYLAIVSAKRRQDQPVALEETAARLADVVARQMHTTVNTQLYAVTFEPTKMKSQLEADPPDHPKIRSVAEQAQRILNEIIQDPEQWVVYQEDLPVEFTELQQAHLAFMRWCVAHGNPEFSNPDESHGPR